MNSGVLRVARGSSGAKAPPLAARPENAITRLPRAPKTQLPEKSTARIGVWVCFRIPQTSTNMRAMRLAKTAARFYEVWKLFGAFLVNGLTVGCYCKLWVCVCECVCLCGVYMHNSEFVCQSTYEHITVCMNWCMYLCMHAFTCVREYIHVYLTMYDSILYQKNCREKVFGRTPVIKIVNRYIFINICI